MKLVVATSNAGKLAEFRQLLARHEIVGLDAYPAFHLPEEVGQTYAENATLKAEAAAKAIGQPVLADDSGIEVKVLGGAPGLFSARYAQNRLPSETQDQANRRYLLEQLRQTKTPLEQWQARFVCVLAYAQPQHMTRIFSGSIEGLVLSTPRGDGGFGYDPLVCLPTLGKTFAELSTETKNRLSHRAKATEAFLQFLDNLGDGS